MHNQGGPIARARSVSERGLPCDLTPGIPAGANITSVRNAPALYGVGPIDAIADEVIAANATPNGPVHGRAYRVRGADGRERVGRFGWKAETATLRQFVAEAFRNDLGITNPLAPVDRSRAASGRRRCAGDHAGLEDDGTLIDAVTAFLAMIPAPAPIASQRGLALFTSAGCAPCHMPELSAGGGVVSLYHDGRARSIGEAIRAHAGEAAASVQHFRGLSPADRHELLAFLAGL